MTLDKWLSLFAAWLVTHLPTRASHALVSGFYAAIESGINAGVFDEPPVQALNEHTLERIDWYCQKASQGPMHVIQVPPEYDPVDWCRDALLYSTCEETYGVSVGTVEEIMERGACMTAFTGNGSESRANANFYMLCHTAVPLLVQEVRRCWAGKYEVKP